MTGEVYPASTWWNGTVNTSSRTGSSVCPGRFAGLNECTSGLLGSGEIEGPVLLQVAIAVRNRGFTSLKEPVFRVWQIPGEDSLGLFPFNRRDHFDLFTYVQLSHDQQIVAVAEPDHW